VTISRWRINAAFLLAMLVIGRIVLQLGNLQVVQHDYLSSKASREIDRRVTIQPRRGVIRDSKGNVLALDVDRESLYVNPGLIDQQNVPKLSLVLAGLLGLQVAEVQAKLQDQDHYARIARWLEPEIAERITALQEPGLDLVPEPRRIYPQGSYAAHTIGAVNYEGVGISGVEGYYDTELKGITGTITAEWDAGNNPIWITPPQTQPASDGADDDPSDDRFRSEHARSLLGRRAKDTNTVHVIRRAVYARMTRSGQKPSCWVEGVAVMPVRCLRGQRGDNGTVKSVEGPGRYQL